MEQVKIPDIHLEDVPVDVLRLVAKNIDDVETIASLCMVDKHFNEKVCNDMYWHDLLNNQFGLSSAYCDIIRGNNSLPALFKYLSRFSSIDTPRIPTLNSVILFSDEMRDFIRHADFGLSDPEDVDSPPLNEVLMTGQNGISMMGIYNDLMYIYSRLNFNYDPTGRNFRTTPDMNRYLSNSFTRLSHKMDFNPNSLGPGSLQQIGIDNVVTDLTPEQERILSSIGIYQQLNREWGLVSRLVKFYSHDPNWIDNRQTRKYLTNKTRGILASRFPDKKIGEMILMRKDYNDFCTDLTGNRNIGYVRGIARKLGVVYDINDTKEELCERIRIQLAEGRVNP